MNRREFLLGAAAAAAWPRPARAGQTGKIPEIGMLWVNSAEAERQIGMVGVLHAKLRELGYVDGQTVHIEERFGDGQPQRMDEQAAELVRRNPDVIVAGAESLLAVAHATKTIPIVAATTGDPVAEGFAESLAHPNGNVTGSAVFFPQIMAKRLELLKLAVPTLNRVGALTPAINPFFRIVSEVMTETAKPLGVEVKLIETPDPAKYEDAFAAAAADGVGGIVVLDSANFFGAFDVLAALALKHKLPTCGAPPMARRGGLIGYGVLFQVLFANAATYVDRILKGARAGDLPIEQASRFETVVNLKTADALALTLPSSLLAAAEVVE